VRDESCAAVRGGGDFLRCRPVEQADPDILADRDFLGMWTDMSGPNDITRGKDGNFYIAEQEDGDKPAYV
jgi:hypothetical protein